VKTVAAPFTILIFVRGIQKMAKKKLGKSARIRNYLGDNPTATWKTAEGDLKRFGISGPYFAMIKSKTMGGATGGSKRGRKASVSSSTTASAVLDKAAEYAKDVGNIDAAIEALTQLKKFQI
jgi:hypothetical protein